MRPMDAIRCIISSMGPIDPRLVGGRRPGADRKKTPQQEWEIARDYRAGMKLLEIRAKHEVSKWTVYAILRRHGIESTRRPKEASCP